MDNLNHTVYIVDDDPSVRKGLGRLLKSNGYDVFLFESANEFLDTCSICQTPVCLLLDMKMPGLDGFDLQQKLNKKGYALPIVFITGYGDIHMSVKAMKKGAIDFLTKPFDEKDLLNAVQEAIKKDIQNRRVVTEQQQILQKIETLTPREYEIMTFVITGMLNKQIAYALGISEKTVKIHRGRVMDKTSLESVAQLVRMADKAGIQPADISNL